MKNKPYRDFVIILALCVVGFILGQFQNRARNSGSLDFVTATLRSFITPPSAVLSNVAQSTSDFTVGFLSSGAIRAENQKLRQMAQVAAMYDERLTYYQREIQRLRADLELGDYPGKTRIPARIIGHSNYENRITLNKGKADQIRNGLPVITPAGLVGIVQTVEERTCSVLLVYSRALQIGARIDRNPPVVGLIRGDSPAEMIMEGLDFSTTVKVGDLVMTSGFSEQIPRGIPIGRVINIEEAERYGSKRCRIFPNVQLGGIQEVFVIR